ncbi:TolC family protein [Paludibacter jiangxiensis]|uniref:Outer membrane protein, cobalt-zinc-cadmium efflux system n=1 Tax=Paludibacter jiangxiensis TaxID=681398 RepID=A0A161LF55_9BACT|nr:TolC family protein [Paludibacter jiangxiensis]GAT63555.1 outer membrane protein, cobalt-zinc-cadmium efflux system [Paludibacter jiangxiensis]
MRKIVIVLTTCLSLLYPYNSRAQGITSLRTDTITMRLDSAENIFVRKNFTLLAQRYNIDAQKALVLQAKLFPNPTFSFGTPLYQTATHKYFPTGKEGEISMGLSQVIMLANKHNKQLKIAQSNAELSEYQFYDLLRTLKHTLRSDFFNIHYLMQSAKVYQTEIEGLQRMADAFDRQKGKGYVSEKEVVRIKAQLYSLQNEYNDLQQQIEGLESEMRLLLQTPSVVVVPNVNEQSINTLNAQQYPIAKLIDTAYTERPDLKIAGLNTKVSTLNLQLQKAMAVPDLTLQMNYDQQGSYIHNLATVGFSIDLPFLNRNQGNIKSARAAVKQNEAGYLAAKAGVDEQIFNALQRAMENSALLQKRDPSFDRDFDRLSDEVLKNYRSRNMSMLDFLDFYDSYKENKVQTETLKFNRLSAFEDLNFYTGTDLFPLK